MSSLLTRGVGARTPPPAALGGALRLRRARAFDVASLCLLEEEIFPSTSFPRQEMERLLAGPGSLVLVAEAGTEMAGFLILWWRRGSSTCRVIDLAVRRRYRRRGLADRLLAAAMREARRQGRAGVTLEVAEGNRPALALYRKHGFRRDRRLPHYYRRHGHALRLVRWLPSAP